MKSLLLVTLEYPPQVGGIAAYLRHLAECFRSGEIVVMAPPHESAHETDMLSATPIFRQRLVWPLVRPGWLPALCQAWRLCRRDRGISGVLVSHLLPMGSVAYLLRRFLGLPYAVILHGMDAALALESGGRKRRLARAIIGAADVVAVNSGYTASLAKSLGATEAQLVVTYPSPGVVASLQPTNEAVAARRKSLAPAGEKIILTAGRLVRRKGFDTAIRALAEVRARGLAVRLAVVGSGPDRDYLDKLVTELGVSNDVMFLGGLTDEELAETHQAADVFSMTPRSLGPDVEGFGIVYLEAGAAGKPTVGSRTGGVPEAVLDDETGLLVSPDDVTELADAWSRLLVNEGLAKRLGEAGRRRVERDFADRRQPQALVRRLRLMIGQEHE